MKRLWAAVTLILIAILFSVLEFSLVNNTYERYDKIVSEIETLFSQKEYKKAHSILDSTKKQWDNEEKILKLFLLHSEVNSISECLDEIQNMLKLNDENAFFYTCEKTKRQLLSLKKSELPYLENIM